MSPLLVVGDLVQLKDQASLSGRIVAEKKEAVFLDVGYTVLSIPRSQILKVVRGQETTVPSAKEAPRGAEFPKEVGPDVGRDPSLFRQATGVEPEAAVRDWVSKLGEAVGLQGEYGKGATGPQVAKGGEGQASKVIARSSSS